jgi:hypothetical protein
MPYVDFQAVKERVSIEDAAQKLNLKLMKAGPSQLRGPCPQCQSGGDRALVITPAKNLYCCFAAGGKGGDQIALTAHVLGLETRDAAQWLGGTVTEPVTSEQVTVTSNRKDHATGFQRLDYLEHDHAAVEALGFDPDVAKALGVGFAGKGILRGTVAVPVRLEDGSLAGYIGVTDAKLPNRWHLAETNVVPLKKGAA